MADTRFYLIDATAFCYRAFYGLKGLSTSFGQPTNAVYGFLNIFKKILKSEKPQNLAVCFDVSRETLRSKKFAEYKIQRPPMPDDLSSQIPLIKKIIAAYGMAIFEKEGYEADDIIATLARKGKDKGLEPVIVSSDKDILQLVDAQTLVLSPGKDSLTTYDVAAVVERYGVQPQKIIDVIALMGDSADNIPGVPGIGEKTAIELIKSFGSVEELLKNINTLKQEKLKASILENRDRIVLNKELVLLDKDMDIDCDLGKISIRDPDIEELRRLFRHLEFKKLLNELPPQKSEAVDGPGAMEVKDESLADMLDIDGELFLYGHTLGTLIFSAGGKDFCLDKPGSNIKRILEDPGIKKTGFDLKKTKIALAKEDIILRGIYFDILIAAYLLNPSKASYEITDIAWDHFPDAGIVAGTNQDSLALLKKLRPRLEAELKDKSLAELFFKLEMPLVEVLAQMELHGIKLDVKLLRELSKDIEKRLIKLIEDIYALSGAQFNINSPKQLRQILFEKLKLPVIKRSKTGPSTDEEVLRALADKHKLPAMLLEYRQLTKLKNTYIDVLPELIDQKTGRIHATFNQTGTETGRLSSSNPNLQNIPIKTEIGRNIRRAIISSGKGNLLLSCDYSQVELRILAHLCKDENLITAFKADKDIHRATAALIYGITEFDVSDEMREVAKRINFGIVYGQSAYGLSRDLGISMEESQNFIDAYFMRYPQVKVYIQEQIHKAKDQGFVTTLLGRRRYIPDISNKNQGIRQFAERQAVNTPIQGSASDLIKLAMLEIHNMIKEKKSEIKMLIQIHDELVFDLPVGEMDAAINLIRSSMENVLKLDVPLRVDIKKGENWLDMEEV